MNRAEANALSEIRQKTLAEIQRETALKWAYRAWAAYQIAPDDALEYEHEAIEHAALSGDDDLLDAVRGIIARAKL